MILFLIFFVLGILVAWYFIKVALFILGGFFLLLAILLVMMSFCGNPPKQP